MKLNVPFWRRIHQLFCRHEKTGWSSATKGVNSKVGQEYVQYECIKCGVNIGEWFEEGAWTELDFPDEYTIQNKRKVGDK